MRKFDELIDEHNSMVGTNHKIDDRSKLEKLKDMVSNIAEFDTVEDTLILSDTADSMPVENILKRYMKKAIAIDKRYKKSQSRTSPARRSNTGLNVNVAESLFDVANDSEAVEASSPDDDIPVEAILSAFASKTYGGGGGYRGGVEIPDHHNLLMNLLSSPGRPSIPKEDRAKIVALFTNSPATDSSRHLHHLVSKFIRHSKPFYQ
jgi:glutamate mutase epsilon subunit